MTPAMMYSCDPISELTEVIQMLIDAMKADVETREGECPNMR